MEAMFRNYNLRPSATIQPLSGTNSQPDDAAAPFEPEAHVMPAPLSSARCESGSEPPDDPGMNGSQWIPNAMRNGSIETDLLQQPQPPPNASRSASEVVDDMAPLPSTRNAPSGQLLRAQTRGKCVGLTAEQTEAVLEFSALSPREMLVELKIHNFRLETDLLKRYFHMFIASPQFETRLRHRIAGIILAPALPAYICGLRPFVLLHIEKPDTMKTLGVPPQCRHNPGDWKKVKELVAKILTAMRNDMKSKLSLSVTNEHHVHSVAASIVMYDMKVKSQHYARIAFLRRCLRAWNTLPASTSQKNDKGKKIKISRVTFWRYVDSELQQIRQASRQVGENEKEHQDAQTLFFTSLLDADCKAYTAMGTDYCGRVYKDGDTLPDDQRIGETVAHEFVIDDTQR
ncbi:hypothetical protein FOMPIDRAFT_1149526, partial [Fomitopsis schrenkii]